VCQQVRFGKVVGLLLEFSIPRKEMRIDIVLLIRDVIVILEARLGMLLRTQSARLKSTRFFLHYFHKASTERWIVPIIVSNEMDEPHLSALNQNEVFPQLASYWIAR